MSTSTEQLEIITNAPISTWYRIGGRADRFAQPGSNEQLLQCLELDPDLKVLGEGANLLVDDSGEPNLVVSLQTDGFKAIEIDQTTGLVCAGAGVPLPRLISKTINSGFGGLQGLAGFPATIGGACIMNAGGRYGSIGDHIIQVHAMDRAGRMHELKRSDIDFDYRQSGLNHLLICSVVFQLTPGDPLVLKEELTECMHYKKQSQPMSEKSAGCAFKNPTLTDPIDSIGQAGDRVSAGMLIDRAQCKGMTVGGASVSPIHANFITTTSDAKAREVIELMDQVRIRVLDTFGVDLKNEVVIWSRDETLPISEVTR
ncbi:MAG: UDP-N-acetylmuramate dehydrogenase [Phycisphaerales bacterium]|nr:UDP-N-acetylmuramate dehydrogenase [Phycisphaerales bacterium]